MPLRISRLLRSSDWQFVGINLLLMILLQFIGPESLRYQRDSMSSGEIWRLLSAHWVHVGWLHLALNGMGLMVCITLTSPRWSLTRWWLQTLLMAIGISFLFAWRNPGLQWYVGFSGVLFGLYLLAAIDLFTRERLVATLIAMAIVAKIIIEQLTSFDFSSAEIIGTPVIVDAHLYGVVLAIAIALSRGSYTIYRDHKSENF